MISAAGNDWSRRLRRVSVIVVLLLKRGMTTENICSTAGFSASREWRFDAAHNVLYL
jgi:hypothetical protein